MQRRGWLMPAELDVFRLPGWPEHVMSADCHDAYLRRPSRPGGASGEDCLSSHHLPSAGEMVRRTGSMLSQGNPPRAACSRINAGRSASYTQYSLLSPTNDSTQLMPVPISATTWLSRAESSLISSSESTPVPGSERSMT